MCETKSLTGHFYNNLELWNTNFSTELRVRSNFSFQFKHWIHEPNVIPNEIPDYKILV